MTAQKDEIEVSEAMVEAGENAVEAADLEISDRELSIAIYCAMERVRREECGPPATGWQPTLKRCTICGFVVDTQYQVRSQR